MVNSRQLTAPNRQRHWFEVITLFRLSTCVQNDMIMIVCFFYSFHRHDRLILTVVL